MNPCLDQALRSSSYSIMQLGRAWALLSWTIHVGMFQGILQPQQRPGVFVNLEPCWFQPGGFCWKRGGCSSLACWQLRRRIRLRMTRMFQSFSVYVNCKCLGRPTWVDWLMIWGLGVAKSLFCERLFMVICCQDSCSKQAVSRSVSCFQKSGRRTSLQLSLKLGVSFANRAGSE